MFLLLRIFFLATPKTVKYAADCRQVMDFPRGELARSELQYAMWSPTGHALVCITALST